MGGKTQKEAERSMIFLLPKYSKELKMKKTLRMIYSFKHRKFRKNYNSNKKLAVNKNPMQ